MDVVILAGGELEAERFQGLVPLVPYKAAVPILGRTMVEWVIEGARSCPAVERIRVVTYPELQGTEWDKWGADLVPEVGSIAGNLRAGLDALPGTTRVLVLSGDLPLVSREALEDLVTRAPEADVVFPYVERQDVLRAFPGREWIFSETPEGAFTGSAVGLCRPQALLDHWQWVEDLLEARRKKPFALAAMFGFSFLLKLLFRRLRVRDIEEKLSHLLHITGRGYRSPYPELAMDVDKFSDIAFVESELARRRQLPNV